MKYKFFWIIGLVCIILILICGLIFEDFYYKDEVLIRNHLIIDEIDLTDHPNLNNISIQKVDNQLVLVDSFNQKIKYLQDKKVYDFKNYHPVHLQDLGDYYVVIYSTNMNIDYSHGRFVQNDYEYNREYDVIYLLNKETGKMYMYREYHLIGKSIDLNSFKMIDDDKIIYHVYADYEIKTARVEVIFISEIMNRVRGIPLMNLMSFLDNRYKYLEKYVITNDRLLWVDNTGYIGYKTFYYHFRADGGESGGNYYSELVKDEEYLRLGYFAIYDNEIYYVGNDLKIYALKTKTYIADVILLENWEDQLHSS